MTPTGADDMSDADDLLAAAKRVVEGVPEVEWEAIACAVYGPGTPTGRRTNLAVATLVQGTNSAPAVAAFIAFARNNWSALLTIVSRAAGLEAENERLRKALDKACEVNKEFVHKLAAGGPMP